MEAHLARGMVLLRALSVVVELTALLVMLRLTHIEALLRLNSFLGLVGPLIFLSVSALGLAGMVGRVNPGRFLLVATGVVLVLLGTRSG